jgi:5-methylcytosine-specific restriction protein A
MPKIKLLRKRRDNVITVRKSEYQHIYQDKRWKFIVAARKRENPLCQRCEAKNKVKPLDEIHHIIPFDTGRTPEEVEALAFDYDNTMSVCEKCHEALHKELKNKFAI